MQQRKAGTFRTGKAGAEKNLLVDLPEIAGMKITGVAQDVGTVFFLQPAFTFLVQNGTAAVRLTEQLQAELQFSFPFPGTPDFKSAQQPVHDGLKLRIFQVGVGFGMFRVDVNVPLLAACLGTAACDALKILYPARCTDKTAVVIFHFSTEMQK